MCSVATRQRSFRLDNRTLALLDGRAGETGSSSNALAQRLLDESLRTERHPLIRFREGGSGLRRPALVGHRLYVWQVIHTVRDSGNDIADAAEYLALSEHGVRACVSYYAEFKDEIDAYAAEEEEFARREEERWRREQEILD